MSRSIRVGLATIAAVLVAGAGLGWGLAELHPGIAVCDHGASSAAVKRVSGVIVVVQPEHGTGCR